MHICTPLIKSLPLSEINGTNVWLKLDALQPSGSFKLRGMGAKAVVEFERGAKKFVSSSGGNAGLGVAWAGMELKVPVTVYVPGSTRQETIDMLKLCRAEVKVVGEHWADAHGAAMEAVKDNGVVYFHPFDDPLVWQGHASIVDEIAASGLDPDLVVCSVGGGGLLSGIMEGLNRNHMERTLVLAMETIGADALYQSLQASEAVTLSEITSKASSLGANRVCDQAFSLLSDSRVACDRVSDESAIRACQGFLGDHRIQVELACGAALSAAYDRHPSLRQSKNVVVVVCGGVNWPK